MRRLAPLALCPALFACATPAPRPGGDDPAPSGGALQYEVLLAGNCTDGPAGFTLQYELEQYVAAGIPAPEVLAMATLGAARVVKRDAELGTVAPGKLADLIVVDGKPDQRIDDVERVEWVLKGGVLRDARKLYQAVGVSAWR
jgi:hypothetical protein